MKELLKIQSQLHAPKGQYNSFGKYNYRSCEDILEAVKPLCKDQNCSLVISDTLQWIGERYYIVATAKLINGKGEFIEATGMAREPHDKKGMDSCQITGAASSYARKYALNGLFAIDDTKDSDATNTHDKPASKAPTKPKVHPAVAKLNTCKNMDELKKVWIGLNKVDQNTKAVIDAKEAMKGKLTDV